MITIKQIAQKAGVSPTTVSNVLHGRLNKISEATFKKVQEVIHQEKYVPNMGAYILSHGISRIIGVVLFTEARSGETILEDPFTNTILGAVENAIRSQGYYMMVYATNKASEVLQLCSAWELDGLLVLWVNNEVAHAIKKQTDTPVVFVDSYLNDDEYTYNTVGLEDEKAVFTITQYLISCGHKLLAFLDDGPNPSGVDQKRRKGFRLALEQAALLHTPANYFFLPRDERGRFKVYDNLLHGEIPFTALVFSSDFHATDAISYFRRRNIPIPGKFSVTGFDNNRFSQIIEPGLTTVDQDVSEKGRLAVQMLFSLIRSEPVENTRISLPTRIVYRSSVRNLFNTHASGC